MPGFLGPTGFTNYMRPGVEGVSQRNISIGGRGGMGSQGGGGIAIPGNTGGPSMAFANSPGLSMQEQYGGPLMNALQDLVRGIGTSSGRSNISLPQGGQANGKVPTTQQNVPPVQGVK